jgi:hypothetical protein
MATTTCVIGGLFAAKDRDFVTAPVDAIDLSLDGIPGDLHGGPTRKTGGREPWHPRGTVIRNDRQVSLVSTEELAHIAMTLGLDALPAEWIGANILIESGPISTYAPMTRLMAPSGATLVITAYNAPCRQSGRAIAERTGTAAHELDFVRAARGLRGIVGYVERPGRIACGDVLKVLPPRGP